MKLTPFGSTGLELPPIVFGTGTLGNLFRVTSETAQRDMVAQWFEQMSTTIAIDSAGKYGAGLALERIGQQLKRLGKSADDVVISNKLGWRRVPLTTAEPTFEPGVWAGLEHDAVQDISYDGILRCYEQGLELLDGAPCQLVSVHDPDEYIFAATDDTDRERRWDDVGGAYQALLELKRAGKVAGVGVGAKDWETVREFSERFELDWVMLANCLTVYSHSKGLVTFLDELHAKNIAVINAAVFNAGFLVGGEFFDYRKIDPGTEEGQALHDWRKRFYATCTAFDVNVPDACVRFGNSPPGVHSVALASSKAERVARNVAAVDAQIPAAFWTAMKEQGLMDPGYPHLPV